MTAEAEEEETSLEVLADILSLAVSVTIPAAVLATWTARERDQALEWAAAEHLSASDNPVTRLPQPELVRRAAEICASPALAQLAVEAWTRHKEVCEEAQPVESPEWVSARMAQDAVTGLLVLLGDRRAEGERPPWQDSAVGIMWRHPEGLTSTDLAGVLGSACPPAEELHDWLSEGGRSGLLTPLMSGQAWRLAWRLKEGP